MGGGGRGDGRRDEQARAVRAAVVRVLPDENARAVSSDYGNPRLIQFVKALLSCSAATLKIPLEDASQLDRPRLERGGQGRSSSRAVGVVLSVPNTKGSAFAGPCCRTSLSDRAYPERFQEPGRWSSGMVSEVMVS